MPARRRRHLDIADAIDAVGGDEGERNSGRDGALDHGARQRRLGRKAARGAVDDLLRHMRLGHARRIVRPALGQIQFAVDERVTARRDIAGEDADLAVGDLARRARILPRDATGRLALLQKPRLVDDENRVVVGQGFERVIAHDVAQRISIPLAATQNSLLPPRTRIASRFRPHPAGLAPLLAEQTFEKILRRQRHPRLREQRTHPTLHVTQRRRPQLQRRLDRCSRHPLTPMTNHGDPESQKSDKPATVMLEPPGRAAWRRQEPDARTATTSSKPMKTSLQRGFIPRLLASLFWAFRQTKA